MELKKALYTLAVNTLNPPVVQFKDARAMFLLLSKIHHPDKGGSRERFLEIKSAWDLVRATLVKHNDLADDDADHEIAMATIAAMVPDRELVPPYCIKTTKSTCGSPDRRIEANQLRFGYLDTDSGNSYTGWEPVDSLLRIPAQLHRRLTTLDLIDGVKIGKEEKGLFKAVLRNSEDVVQGVDKLSPEDFDQFLKVFMHRDSWCHCTKKPRVL